MSEDRKPIAESEYRGLPLEFQAFYRPVRDGEPCGAHPACLSHMTKPCEGCGRIAVRVPASIEGEQP